MQTLLKFGAHTRQSSAELDDVTTLGKKWLAVQCNLAPARQVYAHIANDFPLLELRTHEPPIETYATGRMSLDPQTFVWVTSHLPSVYTHPQGEALSHFVDTFFPRPIDEEAWVKHRNDRDGWKPAAYFLALNCRDNAKFYAMVEAIHRSGSCAATAVDDGAADLFAQLKHYMPLEGSVSARELGELIDTLVITKEDVAALSAKPTELPPLGCDVCGGDDGEAVVAEEDEEELPSAQPTEAPLRTWAELRKDPLVQEYRRVSGLAPTCPVQKVVSSMLTSAFTIGNREGGAELIRDAHALLSQTQLP